MTTIPAASCAALDAGALITTLTDYWTTIFPQVRAELHAWTSAAHRIPDPDRRRLALLTLGEESSLAEGAAIFATLAPRRHRRVLVRLLVAWQLAYDYLDTLGESSADALLDGRAFYAPLLAALEADAPSCASPPDVYLDALVQTSRQSLRQLPSHRTVGPIVRRAALRCIDGQVLTHAAATRGPQPLQRWASMQGPTSVYLWWELAAGAISSLGVHALLANAALPRTATADALAVDQAYFPSICALSTLLDSIIDTAADDGTENHRTITYYATTEQAISRIETITRIASSAARGLQAGRRHHVILSGMTALYATLQEGPNVAVHERVAAALGASAAPIRWSLRLRASARRLRERA